MESSAPGLIPQSRGKLMRDRYKVATIFVDHFSDYTYAHLQTSTDTEQTLEAKEAFERLAATYDVRISRYRADNGRFAERAFKQAAQQANQSLTFTGVGAHHQNGIAERRIRDLSDQARTMLLHAQFRWPEAVGSILWPFALKMACELRNTTRLRDNKTPEQRFAATEHPPTLQHHHPFGCPCYVLDPTLQGNVSKLPRWEPRSRVGVYVGHSPHHAGSVALVLNLSTGHVSPQFHVVFDDDFSTVPNLRHGSEPSNWASLFEHSREQSTTEAYKLAQEWSLERAPSNTLADIINSGTDHPAAPMESTQLGSHEGGNGTASHPQPSATPSAQPSIEQNASTEDPSAAAHNSDTTASRPPPVSGPTIAPFNLAEAGLRRSLRLQGRRAAQLAHGLLAQTGRLFHPTSFLARTHLHMEQAFANRDATLNYTHPCAFQAKLADNEVFHYGQAKKQSDWPDFCRAMVQEINTLDRIWHLVPRSAIGDAKVVKAIWSFKRKRSPDGTLLKHKARLCAHGGMQEHGEHYWDTYSPVVQWLTVRLMLTLSAILGLKSRSIDFTLAYTQADLDVDIYIEIPAGFVAPEGGDWVLKLDKNLYGLKQAGLNWFETLKTALEKRGFRQSLIDPCCFLKDDIIVLVYVDDCLIFCPRSDSIDKLIDSLQQEFTLVDEGDVASYLGAEITKDKDGSILLRQPFLTDRIIEALNLTDQRQHDTPAIDLLHRDADGPPRKQNWLYPSLIGMLNYLSGQTRPDILFATHQCARFMKEPKLSHKIAAKRIVRYLKRTRESGLVLRPDMSQGIKCYVDADFAGSWNKEASEDVASVYSRTGYVIMFANCPILWVSKLQTEVALSTTEAEYIALSQAMRDVIPFMTLVQEISGSIYFDTMKPEVQIKRQKPESNDLVCEVYEDNRGALELAKVPKMRPRTKHIALKYHHFREHVKNGLIRINPVDTKEQVADIFTKPLARDAFQFLRSKLCGW